MGKIVLSSAVELALIDDRLNGWVMSTKMFLGYFFGGATALMLNCRSALITN